jgi:hypothetical protein
MTDDEAKLLFEAYIEAKMTTTLQETLLRLLVRKQLTDRAELDTVMRGALTAFRKDAEPGGIQEQAAAQMEKRLKLMLGRLFAH